MNEILKKVFLVITLALSTVFITVGFLWNTNIVKVQAEDIEQLNSYYELDNVYSTYSPSTNYTIGGAMYSDRDGLSIRPKTTTRTDVGVTLPFIDDILVTADTALVVDVMFYSNLTRTMKLELVQKDTTIKKMQNDLNAYTAKNNEVVSTLLIGNNAFNNNLNASSGFATKDVSAAYNQLVVPFTSLGYAVGDTASLSEINFYAPGWSTGTYDKYLLMGINLSSDFSTTSSFTSEPVWEAGVDSYTEYGAVSANLDIQLLEAGKILMDPSLNGSGSAVSEELVFKFPDALINESGTVDTANLTGMTLEFLNETATNFNGHFKLYSTTGDAIANSNYSNLKTHKVTKDGTEADSNAKYFYPNTNTVGYADSFIRYNFNSTNAVTSESTESFYSSGGELPAQISPYLTFSYDNSTSLSLDGVHFGKIRILTSDISVYENTASSSENVTISSVKGYLGNQVTFTAVSNERIIDTVTLNDVALSNDEVEKLFSDDGLTVTMTGNIHIQVIFDNETPVMITVPNLENGSLELSSSSVIKGGNVRVLFHPNTGYEFGWIKANGVDVSDEVIDNVLIMNVGDEDIIFTAGFKKALEYKLEAGATSSLYNSYPGVIWAEYDAVNVQTTSEFTDADESQSIGVTLTGMNTSVSSGDYLVIDLHNMINMWRTFYITIGSTSNSVDQTYYLINRYNDILAKEGMGIITESSSSANATNSTLTVSKTEGFFGKIIIPIDSFSGVTSIEEITISTVVKDKSYARFNVGNVYITSDFEPESGVVLTSEDLIWNPSESNWTSYDLENEFSDVSFMEKGEISLQEVVANSYGYDALYASLPQNMINEDGYVDLAALGIKGIAIDVNNYNLTQHSMAIRFAGSDNVSLTDTTKTLWQTSISNHPANIIYPSGLVKLRNSAFIPYDDQGVFEGTIYIPFSSISFTSIGGAGSFPTLIQPVLRISPGSMNDVSYSSYDFEIGNIRFITDESDFSTYQITMTQIGGTLTGDIDGNSVSNSANNNVMKDTNVTFTIIPDNGYSITSVRYSMGDDLEVIADLDENNSFEVEVTNDILVQAICNEIVYSITYDLDGGTNNVDNPSNYTIESSKIILEPAEKEGYIFLGWFNNDEKVTEINAGSMGDLTLEANWDIVTLSSEVGTWFQELQLWVKITASIVTIALTAAIFLLLGKKKGK